jgi:hypothetical protein
VRRLILAAALAASLTFRFTWRGHTYAGTERFADPCGNTTGCWVTPGTPGTPVV